jgi:transposase-like protein
MEDEFGLGMYDEKFQDPIAAATYLESIRWPNGPVCPHCGEHERVPYRLNSKATKRRLWKCRACRKQFTVTVGTIFESSHIPLNKWLLAFYLLCSSKKGMSAHQLHRSLGIQYKSAWFMFHRIRHAMSEGPLQELMGGIVEVDETYVGGKTRGGQRGRGSPKKVPVVALVEREGKVKAMHAANVTAHELKGAIREHVARTATIMTDNFPSYRGLDREFAGHETVDHSRDEWVRGSAHTNTVEGYFSILKRGVNGVYHHVSRAHLHRYLTEFDFRYNTRHMTDGNRTIMAITMGEGKRLKYADSSRGRAR